MTGETVIKEMSGNVERLSVFKERISKNKWYSIPKRYVQAALGFIALFIVFWMRTSFFTAFVNIITSHAGEIPWTYKEMNLIDSAFGWGFTAAQIPGALLTLIFPSHRVLLVSVGVMVIFHLILAFFLYSSAAWLVIIRLLQGIAEGPLFPACVGIWKSWAPPSERTRLFCIVLCGPFFGLVAGTPVNIKLLEYFGAKPCFFISATSGIIWCLVWVLLIYESPSSHPHISHYELSYLEENIDVDSKLEITVKSIPWKSIFSSLPVWAVFLAGICYCCSQYVLLISPYLYYRYELKYQRDHTILDLLLPNIILGAVVFASGFIADFLVNVVNLPRTLVRKVVCCGAFTLHGIALLVMRYYRNIESTVICVYLAHGFMGLSIAGFWVNCLDFSPYYGTVLMALCQAFGGLSDIIIPVIVASLLGNDIFEWPSLFDALITMSFIVALMYAFFGSGNVQSWGKPETMHTHTATDESLVSTYYSYPDDEDCVELVGDGQQLPDLYPEQETERH